MHITRRQPFETTGQTTESFRVSRRINNSFVLKTLRFQLIYTRSNRASLSKTSPERIQRVISTAGFRKIRITRETSRIRFERFPVGGEKKYINFRTDLCWVCRGVAVSQSTPTTSVRGDRIYASNNDVSRHT